MYDVRGQSLPDGAGSTETNSGTTEESLESLQLGLERARRECGSEDSRAIEFRLSSLFDAAEQILASARAALNRRT